MRTLNYASAFPVDCGRIRENNINKQSINDCLRRAKGSLRLIARRINIFLIVLCLLSLSAFSVKAQSDTTRQELFGSDEILQLKLTARISEIIGDLSEESEEQPAIISYIDDNGEEISIPLKVRTRGNFRKKPENCNFPPLKLFLSKKNVLNTLFEGQDEIKLVTHCMTDQPDYEQFVFQEYLVYRLYNQFTPFSFRVRLAEITYVEEENPEDRLSSYAFFIERPKNMAGRSGGKIMDAENFRSSEVDMEVYRVLSMFQYMVANNDWFVARLHNIELVTVDPLSPPIPVPYDFDYAGIVEAPYRASMTDTLEFNSHDRIYKGICGKRKDFIAMFDFFQERKDDVFSLYQEFELLDLEPKARTILSLSEFFNFIDRPGNAIQVLRRTCYSGN